MIFTPKKLFSILFVLAFFILPLFSSAQTSTSTPPDTQALIKQLQSLVASLQKQITDLQTQLKTARGEIQEVKEEVKELKLNRSVAFGAKGDDIRELQEFLKQDPEIYPEGLITGFFGPATEAAIRRFQEKNGIESIGIVGPKTLAKINTLIISSFAKASDDKEGAGKSDKIPPGLLHAPGIQKKLGTTTEEGVLPPMPTPAGTIPAIPAQPIGQTGTTTIPAISAVSATTTGATTIIIPPPATGVTPPPSATPLPSGTTTPPPSTGTSTTTTPTPPLSQVPSSAPSPTPPPSTATTDTRALSSPTGLTAAPSASPIYSVALSWSKSTGNIEVVGYKVYRNGIQIFSAATSTSLAILYFTDGSLTPSTSYSYTVAAYDAAGNVSAQSSPISATTAASPSPSAFSTSVIADFTAFSPVSPWDVAMNGSDFVVTDADEQKGLGRLFRVTPSGQISTIASGFGRLFGVGVNGSDIFVTTKAGDLVRIASNGTTTTIAQGVVSPGFQADIAFSGSDIIITDDSGGRLLRVTLGGVVSVIASGLINISSVVASGQNLIISHQDSNHNTLLSRVAPNGAVSILWSSAFAVGQGTFNALAVIGSDIFAFLGNDSSSLYRFTQDGVFIAKKIVTLTGITSGIQIFGLTTDGSDIIAPFGTYTISSGSSGKLLRIKPASITLVPTPSSLASILQSFSTALADIQKQIQKLLR